MPSPYRERDEHDEHSGRAEIVYVAMDPERRLVPARTAIQGVVGGIVGGVVAAVAGAPQLAAAVVIAAVLVGIVASRRGRDPGAVVLRVDRGDLLVTRTGATLARMRLGELLDVTLDTKSIRKVEPGGDVVPGTHAIHTTVGPEIEVARIALRVADRPTVLLTETYAAHMDSMEWSGKIRSFLRDHGWVPQDERRDLLDEEADEADS